MDQAIIFANPTVLSFKSKTDSVEYGRTTSAGTVIYIDNEIKTIIEFKIETNTKKQSILAVGFYYYPYSILVSMGLIVISVALFVLFSMGIFLYVWVPIWILIIGLGMLRTLLIAGRERHASDDQHHRWN